MSNIQNQEVDKDIEEIKELFSKFRKDVDKICEDYEKRLAEIKSKK